LPIVARMFASMLRKLDPIMQDRGTLVTYYRYTGVGPDDEGNPEDQFDDFTILALRGNSGGWTTTPEGRVRIQSTRESLIMREKDLPDGVTVDDLGKNDKIGIGSQRYDIVSYRPVRGLVFRVEIEGG
jgi:hypothetical protein